MNKWHEWTAWINTSEHWTDVINEQIAWQNCTSKYDCQMVWMTDDGMYGPIPICFKFLQTLINWINCIIKYI